MQADAEVLNQFKTIVDTLSNAIYWIDSEKCYLGCNKRYLSNIGLSSVDQLIGQSLVKFVSKARQSHFIEMCDKVWNLDKSIAFKDKVIDLHGKLAILHITIQPLLMNNKKVGLLISEYDISTFKSKKSKIVNSTALRQVKNEKLENYFNNIIKHIPASIYWKNKNFVIEGGNIIHAQLCGFSSPEEVIGKTDYDFPWKNEAAAVIANDREVMETQKTQTFEETGVMPDGTKHIFLTKKCPLTDANNKVIGLLGISIDITKQKQAEKELLKAKRIIEDKSKNLETYLNNIITHLPASIYWKDKNFSIIGDNLIHAQLCGFSSPAEVTGKTDYDFPWKKEADSIIANDREVMQTRETHTFEEIATMTDGTIHTFLTKKNPLIDDSGNVIGVLGISIDITEQKILEERLRKTEASEARFRAMSALGGMIAHELRTPLTGLGMSTFAIQNLLPMLIQGYEQSIAAGKVGPIRKDRLELLKKSVVNMERSIKYAQTTINTILMGFHCSDADAAFEIAPFSLQQLVKKAIAEYPFDSNEDHLYTIKHIDDVFILGGELMVVHVLHNLLKNALYAINAEGRGEITIWSELVNDTVNLYIEDTAKGIESEQLTHIFEAFYTTKKKTAASIGLGLYFCKMALHKMHGDITCESKLGQYTRFKITLPLMKAGV